MTTDSKREYVREKCIEANPEIIELKFGCEVRVLIDAWGNQDEGSGEYCEAITDIGYITHDDYLEMEDERFGDILVEHIKNGYIEDYEYTFEIIGRKIGLADVIYTIWQKNPANRTNVVLESSGQFRRTHTWGGRQNKTVLGPEWNLLKDDLSQQSEEIISFLYELLS